MCRLSGGARGSRETRLRELPFAQISEATLSVIGALAFAIAVNYYI